MWERIGENGERERISRQSTKVMQFWPKALSSFYMNSADIYTSVQYKSLAS